MGFRRDLMFSKVKWRQWKDYSGPFIKPTTKLRLSEDSNHWERIVWLTAQVESGGKFGAIVGYDGTGITAGLNQCISVFPKELSHEDNNPRDDQGPLWKLLEYIRQDCRDTVRELEDELFECGWVLKDNYLYHIDGGLVNGREIREEFTPNQGKVPKFGRDWDSAKSWALIFNDIFADQRSFNAQIRFAIDHAYKTARRKPHILRGQTVESLIYQGNVKDTKLISPDNPMDLAMAVFFSNAVNAPAMAFRKLKQAYDEFSQQMNKRPNWQNRRDRFIFAKTLIYKLGTADYARWNFKVSNGRYQRTLKAATKRWPINFFEGADQIMPRRL
jgi:hypothetical protein